MKERIKGWLAGLAYRVIVLFTFGQISPLLGAGAIIEQDGKILLIDRSDGLGYTIPGGIVRHRETVEQCVLREVREETGYEINLSGLIGVYSSLKRDPRFRAVAIAFKGSIVSGTQHGSGEGEPCWRSPEEVFGHMAFDCEDMLKDYLSGQQRRLPTAPAPGASGMTRPCRPTASSKIFLLALWSRSMTSPQRGHS
jgi:8-oxo-dGTP diphosphatase